MRWISAVIVTAALFASPAVADGYVYWTNIFGPLDDSTARNGYVPHDPWPGEIGRANLDGSRADEQFIDLPPASLTGIDVNDEFIYWTTGVTGATIGRARLDGSEVEPALISGLDFPIHIAIGGDYIYWANYGTHSIGRASLDGSGVDEAFVEGVEEPSGVAVDGSHIYWTDLRADRIAGQIVDYHGAIGKAGIDGGDVDHEAIPVEGSPVSVALGDGYLYWAQNLEPAESTIGRATIDGHAVDNRFIVGFPRFGIDDIAIDENHIYWAPNYGPLGRAALDGTTFDPDFIDQTNGPRGIAVDEGDPHPVISDLRVTPRRFRLPDRPALMHRASVGAIELTLSKDATVTFRVRRDPALRQGSPPPKHPRLFRRKLSAGGHSIPFDGRIGRLQLAPHRYNLVAVARDPDGLRSRLAQTHFRIVG